MKIISVDNLDRDDWNGDEYLIADSITDPRAAQIMCDALNAALCLTDADRFYKVVLDNHTLKKFRL